MLVLSLIGSLVLVSVFLLVNKESFRPSSSAGWSAFFFVGFAVFPIFCMMYSPVLALNALLVAIACAVCAVAKPSAKVFRGLVLAATVSSYLIVGLPVFFEIHDDAGARDKYPLTSMRSRLAYERSTSSREAASNAADPQFAVTNLEANSAEHNLLEVTESKVSDPQNLGGSGYDRYRRNGALRRLHASAVTRFVQSPGFGVTRMSPYNYGPEYIEQEQVQPIPQPAPISDEPAPYPDEQPGDAEELADAKAIPIAPTEPALWETHTQSVVDFVNDGNFGYYRDRDHVAGFESHRFQQTPKLGAHDAAESASWQIGRVELVSLLKHAEPRVYESEHLPNMDELQQATTRTLDDFERAALPMLVAGKDMVIDEQPAHVRMLGALRAGKQCLACHEVKRGDLLGAFSYRIRRTSAPQQKQKAPSRPVTRMDKSDGEATIAAGF